ncbi:hypothetical protein [Halopiger djelfimassiliensis]|uniref:hypothetical protein n=1 Tax=Halopiger djelfimassiliensis TaxID=1293047 RepID=UPI0012B59574|nr:hypothetical protein [Halopiger djelfimassiliensis]
MSRDTLAEVTDNPEKEVPILHALRRTRDSDGELSDEREAVYRTVDIDRWGKIQAAYDAADRLEEQINRSMSTDAVQISVTTDTDGHHEKNIIQADYVAKRERQEGNNKQVQTTDSDAQFKTLQENTPSEVMGEFESSSVSYNQSFDVEFNKIEKSTDPLKSTESNTYYDYEYRPLVGGACFGDSEDGYCTLGATVTDDSTDEQMMVTAGHCLEDSENSYQPHDKDKKIGGPDPSRVVDEYGFDAGVIDTSGVEHKSDLASDGGEDSYKGYNIVGTLMEDTLKDYEDRGTSIEKQGGTTGTVEGPVTHVGENTDYLQIHADRDGGDSGGPYFEYVGHIDILLAGIHRGPGETDGHSEGTKMHAIEDRFEVSAY